MCDQISYTWKVGLEASMVTDIGPTVATAFWRSDSFFEEMYL